ncbi:glutathione S-transferase family protein [Pelagibius sp.]|uniref:glutathione S-transferase family protein n=1 Tax=Pelagibius sp. TaxID=1931238 RepID=UPI003BB14DB3
MILVGQFDSPFVRRVAIALHHYGIPFERRVLSVFKDFDAMLNVNPLGKVPSLVLDDDETLFDSRAIIDYLDGIADPALRLAPTEEPQRRQVLKIEVVGIGLAEKVYERGLEYSRRAPGSSDPDWRARLETQIRSACGWLENLTPSPWLFGETFTRADLAVAVAMQYLERVVPELDSSNAFPRLQAHRRHCEALAAFAAVQDSTDEARASGWRPEPPS